MSPIHRIATLWVVVAWLICAAASEVNPPLQSCHQPQKKTCQDCEQYATQINQCETCPAGTTEKGKSWIDVLGFCYYHDAVDWAVPSLPGAKPGCASCGAGAAGTSVGDLERLAIGRIHRPRDFWIWSSFGPGIFLDRYDAKLHLVRDGYGNQTNVWVFDPRSMTHWEAIFERNAVDGDYAADGVFHDNLHQFADVRIYDATGALTPDFATAAQAVLTANDGHVYTFEVIDTVEVGDPDRDARLVSIADRNGNTTVLTYAYPASASDDDLGFDRTRLWQIATITDPYGVTATVSYHADRVFGWWGIERIGFPDGTEVRYEYSDNTWTYGLALAKIYHADGTVSTITNTIDSETQSLVQHFDDNAAGQGHIRKDVYLALFSYELPDGSVVSQPGHLLKRIVDGAGDLCFRMWEDPVDLSTIYVYTGGGHLERVETDGSRVPLSFAHATAPFDPATQLPWAQTFDVVKRYTIGDQDFVTQVTDALGRVSTIGYDPLNRAVTDDAYPDGSVDHTDYNRFCEPLHRVDRLGRVTDSVYDAHGNLLQRTVAVGTSAQATRQWAYNGRGQPVSAVDADGNVTTYAYDAIGYLAAITEPGDRPGDPPSTWHYAHDALGHLLSTTDPDGRLVSYTYDARNRVTGIAYADGTSESFTYGTGADANLLVDRVDRDGNHTTFGYDGATRTVRTTWASGLPEAVSELVTYVPGTSLQSSRTLRGERTDYAYDQRLRPTLIATHPTAARTLSSTVAYDVLDRRVAELDPFGRATAFVYDLNDRVARTVRELVPGGMSGMDPAGLARITTPNPPYVIDDMAYDALGEELSHVSPRGHRADSVYDAQGRVVSHTDAADATAATTSFSYDPQGNRLTQVLPDGGTHRAAWSYTARNLVATMTMGDGSTVAGTSAYTYTGTKRVSGIVDPRGNLTSYTYSPCCDRLEQITDPAGDVVSFSYDGNGNIIATVDGAGDVTATTYDGLDRPISSVDGEGAVTRFTYDDDLTDGMGVDAAFPAAVAGLGLGAGADGAARVTTDPLGHATIDILDGLGRLVRRVDALGHATTETYDILAGDLVESSTSDALGHVTRTRIDAAGDVRQLVDAAGAVSTRAYDAEGDVLAWRDANGVGADATYDALRRRTAVVDTAGAATAMAYDLDGNLLTQTDALGASTRYVYDDRERLTQVVDRLGGVTTYAYDAASEIVRITDGDGSVSQYAYDVRGLVVDELLPPDASGAPDHRTYAFDRARRLASRVTQDGVVTTYAYDHDGRLLSRHYPDGDDRFVYDPASRPVSAASARYGTSLQRTYDAANRLLSETQGITVGVGGAPSSWTIGYAYDDADRTVSTTYPDGRMVTRSFTSRDQLAHVAFAGASVADRGYDTGGRLASTAFANGVVQAYAYTPGDDLVAAIAAPGAATPTYAYDADKRVLSQADPLAPRGPESFTYDAEGRLTGWSRGDGSTQAWSLTHVGDWTSTTIDSVTQPRAHSAAHEVVAIAGHPLAYDAKGDLAVRDDGAHLAWDAENRLRSADAHDGPTGATDTATYAYDPLGRRIAETVFGRTTFSIHDGERIVYEVDTPAVLPPSSAGDDGALARVALTPPGDGILPDSQVLLRVNFQPEDRAIPPGFVADKGRTYGVRSNGLSYGWVDGPHTGIARGVHPFPQYDTTMPFGSSEGDAWQVALPDGNYPVVVVMGDAARLDSTNNVRIEQRQEIDPTPYDPALPPGYEHGQFDGYAVIAEVHDGRLTIRPGHRAFNPKLCFIEIGKAGSGIDHATRRRLHAALASARGMTGAAPFPPVAPSPRAYVYGPSIDDVLARDDASGRSYFHLDRIGSLCAVTDGTGGVVERYRYSAYGERTAFGPAGDERSRSSLGNAIGFTGRWHDDATALLDFRHRQVDPRLGRFISRDPLGYMGGDDLYAATFVPNAIDPFGEKDCKKATKEKNVTLYTSDVDFNTEKTAVGGAGTLSDAVKTISDQLAACECIKRLTIVAHGNPDGAWIRGRHAGEDWNTPAVTKMTKGLDSNVLTSDSAGAFGTALSSDACFCKDCTIYILACNTGLGGMPQALANATGCKVFAPKGYCSPNPGDPGKSGVNPSIPPKTDPHYPDGLPAYPGAGNGMGEFPPKPGSPVPGGGAGGDGPKPPKGAKPPKPPKP
jgi:RHS repeat-associated protein